MFEFSILDGMMWTLPTVAAALLGALLIAAGAQRARPRMQPALARRRRRLE